MSPQEMKTVPVRSAQQIVDQTEELAALLMKEVYQRHGEGIRFHESQNPRAQHVWRLACQIQELLTDTDPEDALMELEDEPGVPANPEVAQGFLVLQEGGSSAEMYAHGFDTIESADSYRESCVKDGSYRTSQPIPIPQALLDHPDFCEVAQDIAKGAVNVDYPEVKD